MYIPKKLFIISVIVTHFKTVFLDAMKFIKNCYPLSPSMTLTLEPITQSKSKKRLFFNKVKL